MYGTDVYILAQQMGTSVEMIQDYYSHVEAVKNPDLVLKGIPGFEIPEGSGEKASGVNADAAGAKRETPSEAREKRFADGRESVEIDAAALKSANPNVRAADAALGARLEKNSPCARTAHTGEFA